MALTDQISTAQIRTPANVPMASTRTLCSDPPSTGSPELEVLVAWARLAGRSRSPEGDR